MRATRKIVRNKRGSTRRRRRSGEATRKLSLFKKKQQQLKEELNKHDIKLTKKQHTKYAKLLVKMSVIAVSGMIIAREMTIGEASRKRHDNIMADLDQNIAYFQLCRKIINNQISPTSALKQLLQFIKTPADKKTIHAHINANPSRIGPAYREKKLSVLIPYPAQNKYVEIWFTEEKDGDRIYLTVQEEVHAYYQRSSNNNDDDTDEKKIKECYDILNVTQGVDNKRAIIVNYRRLALKHHPDRGGDEETFKKIVYAYKQLLHHIENK